MKNNKIAGLIIVAIIACTFYFFFRSIPVSVGAFAAGVIGIWSGRKR